MTSSAPQSVADVLIAAAGEALDLAQMADDLQSVIVALSAGADAEGAKVRSEVLVGCQAADMLSQGITGLALYLNRLAASAPDGVMMDAAAAARTLPLGDQAARLGGWARPREAEASGELELFDGQF
jgi:hypothetical protein